jgi:hypothetical protein
MTRRNRVFVWEGGALAQHAWGIGLGLELLTKRHSGLVERYWLD